MSRWSEGRVEGEVRIKRIGTERGGGEGWEWKIEER